MPEDDKRDGKEEYKVFVGGLSWKIDDKELKEAFSQFDAVDATIMLDKMTNRPRGFGFVYMPTEKMREDAIAEMHGKEIDGRKISVVKAVPQNETKPGTPAAALGGGDGARSGYGRREYAPRESYGRDRGGGYGGYDQRGGGYEQRGYGGGYGGYSDPRYGYERGSYGGTGYGGDYGRDAYGRDPYGRDAYGRPYDPYAASYDPYSRGGYPAPAYDDRAAGGADRRGYSAVAARPTPYDRAPPRDGSRPPR